MVGRRRRPARGRPAPPCRCHRSRQPPGKTRAWPFCTPCALREGGPRAHSGLMSGRPRGLSNDRAQTRIFMMDSLLFQQPSRGGAREHWTTGKPAAKQGRFILSGRKGPLGNRAAKQATAATATKLANATRAQHQHEQQAGVDNNTSTASAACDNHAPQRHQTHTVVSSLPPAALPGRRAMRDSLKPNASPVVGQLALCRGAPRRER